MSALPLISDKRSLTTWLQQRPDRDAAVLAHRAAMRVAIIPLWALTTSDGSSGDPRALNVLRCAMTSGLPLHFMDRDVIAACERAFQSGGSDNHLAANAGLAVMAATIVLTAQSSERRYSRTVSVIEAADQALSAHVPADTVWEAVCADGLAIEGDRELRDTRLWFHKNPLAQIWNAVQPVFQDLPAGDFWRDWYQAALDGRPQDIAT